MTATHRSHPAFFATILFLSLLLAACQTPTNAPSEATETDSSILTPDKRWAVAVSNGDGLGSIYTAEAIGISMDGSYYQGLPAIKAQLAAMHPQGIDTIFNLAREVANRDSTYTYEISGYTTPSGDAFRQLAIWNHKEEQAVRELEFLAKADLAQRPASSVLDTYRQLWIERCNAHDAYKLVAESYTPNALYYNHKPLVIGTDSIAKDYSYMNRPGYELLLTPLAVEMVSTELAFEIGQCSGSYGGKYVLVWQKNEAGIWQVLFDSNI